MIQELHPYKPTVNSLWVFDDPRVALVREPFVPSMGAIIDRLVVAAGLKTPQRGFRLLFSHLPFDGSTRLDWVSFDGSGNTYKITFGEETLHGWLCPQLYCYFNHPAPRELHVVCLPLK